jgi:hypothetical protein
MPLHVLYFPVHGDFLREGDLATDKTDPRYGSTKPITTEKPSPTRAGAPAGSPAGTHWMMVTDEDDSTVLQPDSPIAVRGEPVVLMRGQHAVRLFPLKAK